MEGEREGKERRIPYTVKFSLQLLSSIVGMKENSNLFSSKQAEEARRA